MGMLLEDQFKKPSENKFGDSILECLKKKYNKKLKKDIKEIYLKILNS